MEKMANQTLEGRGLLPLQSGHDQSVAITSHPVKPGDPTHTCSPRLF